MEKKSNFSIIPNWLVDEFKTAKEFQAYLKMYNGWCLMKDADGWYYRSISKLKEDFGMNPNCSRTRVTQIIKRFEELGILHVKSNGKGTNWYKFDEVVLFNHIEENEEEGGEQDVPQGREQVVPHQEEGVGNKLYPLYNTKENIKEIITSNNITCTENDRTVPPDINGIQFWDNPLIYVMDLVSFPYDNYWCPLKDFIKQGYFKEVREAISQIEDKALREYLNEDIDNCIQRLKSA